MSVSGASGGEINAQNLEGLGDSQVVVNPLVLSGNGIDEAIHRPHQTTYIELINADGSSGGLVEGLVFNSTGDQGTDVLNVTEGGVVFQHGIHDIATVASGQNHVVYSGTSSQPVVFPTPTVYTSADMASIQQLYSAVNQASGADGPVLQEIMYANTAGTDAVQAAMLVAQGLHDAGQPVSMETVTSFPVTSQPSLIIKPVGKGPFPCDFCDKEFPKYTQLVRHTKKHENDKEFNCTECDAEFNIKYNLTLHMAIHNTADGLLCPDCGKTFVRTASLKAHLLLHAEDETLICPECGDEFSAKGALNKHIMNYHQAGTPAETSRQYVCKTCLEVFDTIKTYRDHQKHHHKVKVSLSHRPYKRQVDRSRFTHKCKHCDKAFQKPSQLTRHVRIHTGEKPYACQECNKRFNQKGALQAHSLKHTGLRPYKCEFCPQTFSQKGNVRSHVRRLHNKTEDTAAGLTYNCHLCSCVFKKLGPLNAHISRSHTSPVTPPLVETSVNDNPPQQEEQTKEVNDVIQKLLELSAKEGTDENVQLQLQEMAASGNVNSDILSIQKMAATGNINSDILQQALENSGLSTFGASKPSLCMMQLHDMATGTVKKHILRRVNGVQWHQCTYCAKEFRKPSDLVRHYRIHTHEKPFKCQQCFRSFSVKSTLTAHCRTHVGLKNFKCETCMKMFTTAGSLKIHHRLHTGSKPFSCPHCEKSFRTTGQRKTHMQFHFKDGDVDPRKTYSGKSVRKKILGNVDTPLPDIPLQEPILITDTGLIQQPPRSSTSGYYNVGEGSSLDRPYKCAYCSRGFKKSSHLKQHIRSHTGEKPYKCLQCARSFISPGVLKAHVRTHTGLKQYKCLICDSMFTTNGSLKRHMSTHSEVRPFMCPYCQKTFKTSVNCKKHMKIHRQELALQTLSQQSSNKDVVDESSEVSEDPSDQLVAGNLTTTIRIQGPGQEQQAPGSVTAIQQEIVRQLNSIAAGQSGQLNPISSQIQSDTNAAASELQEQLLEQTLNQQVLGQQSILNNLNQGLSIQSSQQLQNTLDSLTSGGLQSTNISNILQSRDVDQLSDVAQPEPVTQSEESIEEVNVLEEPVDQPYNQHTLCPYPDCGRILKNARLLKLHTKTHKNDKPYVCSVCSRKFMSVSALKTHIQTHSPSKDHTCTVCHQQLSSAGSLTRHLVMHSCTFTCKTCFENFRSAVLLKQHEATSHRGMANNQDSTIEATKTHRTSSGTVVEITKQQTEQLKQKTPTDKMSTSEKILLESAAERDMISEVQDSSTLAAGPKFAHRCKTCPKTFKKPSDLVRHNRIHTGERPFECYTCNRRFTVKSTLDSHMKTHSGYSKNFSCHVCNSTFATRGTLKVHMRLHTGSKPYKCPHCVECFRTSGHRKAHIKTHFRSVEDSISHRRTRRDGLRKVGGHPAQISLFTDFQGLTGQGGASVVSIDPSQLVGTSQNQLVGTSQNQLVGTSQNQSGMLLSVGDEQGSGQSYTAQLVPGLDGVQLQLGGNQAVQVTGLDLSALGLSQTHIQIDSSVLQQLTGQTGHGGPANINLTVSNGQSTMQLSEAPGIGTAASETLDQNVVAMNAGKEHGGNAAPDSLDSDPKRGPKHIPIILPDPERNFGCPVCFKAFKRTGHLKEHMETHVNTAVKNRTTRYTCTHCDKGFNKPSQLERHVRIHTGERPFVCEVCQKSFNQKNALTLHQKKHSGERPHACEYCEMTFAQKCNLKIHIKRMHHAEMVESMNMPKTTEEGEDDGAEVSTLPDSQDATPVEAAPTQGTAEEVWYLTTAME